MYLSTRGARPGAAPMHPFEQESVMSKGLDKKKEAKKKPAKTLKEKRALKEQKKAGR